MVKFDKAQQQTFKDLEKLEKRIKKIYSEARREMQEKVDEYFKLFEAKDEEQREKLKAGEITKSEYTQWRISNISRGDRYIAIRDELAERMTKANEIAAAYINGDIPKIYSLNRRFELDDVINLSNGMLDGASFIQYDEQVVKLLVAKQPDLMPYYPKQRAIARGIDLKYGKKQITASITSGILQGKSTNQIAKDVMDHVENINKASAVRAARTSYTSAMNGGRQVADEELVKKGAILKKVWRCAFYHSRDIHMKADGQERDIDEPFNVGGEKLMFPGDGSMGASGWNLYNCQCVMERKVVGYKSMLTQKQKTKIQRGK